MILPYEIQDLDGRDYLVHFEFHRERDGQLVYDAAFTIQLIWDYDGEAMYPILPCIVNDGEVVKWLETNEHVIYAEARRWFPHFDSFRN